MTEEAEVIEPTETEEVIEQQEGEAENVNDVSEGAAEDMGLVVEIGGEEEEEGAPEWVKNVRRENRELKKRLKEIETKAVTTTAAQQLPPEPELEDFDYDAEAFKKAHREWVKQSAEFEKREAEAKAAQERANQRWQQRLSYYDEGKEKLGAQDYDEAEATVAEILAPGFPGILAEDVRLGIIKQGAKDPAALVYALGKNPAKAKELAEIDDPVEFAWKCAALEASMKVVRGKAPPPEKKLTTGVPGVAGAIDNTLERLRAEAEKTGDYSKVVAYKRQMKA